MKLKVQTQNTLYSVIELNNKLYIQGHPEYCPNYTACDFVTMGTRMVFKPCGGETIYTSSIKTIDIETTNAYVDSEAKIPAFNLPDHE